VSQNAVVATGLVDQKKAFDAFNDNFEDHFKTGNDNFAKFEAFETHNFSSDFGNTSFEATAVKGKAKEQNGQVAKKKDHGKEPVKDKFAADYSKPESFDADLEEALKRSVLDN